jgi:glycosyltransferase involved in cell wall biosynthesis
MHNLHVVWLLPDWYSFLEDEIRATAPRVSHLSLLCPSPLKTNRFLGLPNVTVHPLAALRPWDAAMCARRLRTLAGSHSAFDLCRSRAALWAIFKVEKSLHQINRNKRIDLIHSHFAYPGGLGACCTAINLPHVVTLRGYDILTCSEYGAIWDPFFRKNLSNCYGTGRPVWVASSESHQAAKRFLGPESDVTVIPNGIDVDSFKASGALTRASLGLAKDDIVLITVGNLVPRKQTVLALQAMPDTLRHHKVKLLICGDGPERQRLEAVARSLHISDNVRFLGALSREKLADVYSFAQVLVHNALTEGFGNVFLEAMLFRLVVISSPVGAAPDLIEDGVNGFTTRLGDAESLKSSLNRALRSLPNFGPQLDANKSKVEQNFTIERKAAIYERKYLRLTGH